MSLPHPHILRIGSRGSQLALAQVDIVKAQLLRSFPTMQTETVVIHTTGDHILDRNLNEIGGKGLFIKEIEEALLRKEIDIAVHSMKDMVAFLPEALTIPCVLEREDPRDALITAQGITLADLPKAAVVGTSSPRRTAQVLALRPDVQIVPFRGNIQTRMQKLQQGQADATFLAMAGLRRSHMVNEMVCPVAIETMLPAVAQGIIGIECRKADITIVEMLGDLNHQETMIRMEAERGFLKLFDGSCRTPIAAHATLNENELTLQCCVARTDGSEILTTTHKGSCEEAENIGVAAALELKEQIDDSFFD